MFRKSPPRRHAYLGWGAWLCIFGLGLFLFSAQSTLFSAPQTSDQGQNQPAEAAPQDDLAVEPWLADYDPQAHPFLKDNPPDDRPLWLSGGELMLKLLFVIGLVYLVLAGLRRLQSSRGQQTPHGTTIRVLETTGLAPGRSLHLVAVGEKTLLIGATDHQLSLLAELAEVVTPGEEEISPFDETLALANARTQSPALDWQTALETLRTRVRRIGQGHLG